MSHDGVAAIDDAGVIAALVEHTHIQPQHGGEEDVPIQRAFVGADDHHVLPIQLQILILAEQSLQNLIAGTDAVKAHQGHGVLNAGVVSVEGDEVAHAQILQILQRLSAVQTFPGGAAVLSDLVQVGHDDVDALGAAADSADDALEILKMIVGRHGHLPAVHLIGFVVGSHVGQNINVISAYSTFDHALALAGAEPGAAGLDEEIVPIGTHQGVKGRVFQGFLLLMPLHQPAVDQLAHFLAAGHGDQAQRSHGSRQKLIIPVVYKIRHKSRSFLLYRGYIQS